VRQVLPHKALLGFAFVVAVKLALRLPNTCVLEEQPVVDIFLCIANEVILLLGAMPT
jgi:hypothetical protein